VLVAGTRGIDGIGGSFVAAVSEGEDSCYRMTSTVEATILARGKLDVVRAIEVTTPCTVPGPWSGFVGDALTPGDPLWITALERVATCPWSSFVARRLGVRPLPDPNLGLPDPDALLVGTVVHEVLEHIVAGDDRRRRLVFEQAATAESAAVPWPSNQRLEELLTDAAERVVLGEGLVGFGLAGLLKASARPVLDVARRIDWPDGVLRGVVASEIDGTVTSQTTGRRIGFRADRLDEGFRATDYKSGKPQSSAATSATRSKHLLNKVRRGRLLQAVAYALAAPEADGAGRYVFLNPFIGDAPEEARVAETSSGDEDLCAAFHRAVAVIEDSLVAGAAFPRVAEPKKNTQADHCRTCPVVEACRVDDTAFDLRLKELMETGGASDDSALEAARELWWLGVEREDGS
jgi:hypothetical protein